MTGVMVGPRFLTSIFNKPRPVTPGGGLGPVQQRAEAIWEAEAYAPAAKEWLKDRKGNGHHMKLGSVARADVLDGALVVNGVATQYATTPDTAAFAITGDIDLRWHGSLDKWVPATFAPLVGNLNAGLNGGYELGVLVTGLLQFAFYDGTLRVPASTAAPVVTDGSAIWLRVTRNSTTGDVKFYTSPDGVTWNQLGATVATAASSMAVPAAALQVGARPGGLVFMSGRIMRAIVKNGIAGTTVYDADFSTLSDGVPWFLESTGKRVTVMPVRSAVVDGALWLSGTNGYYALSPDTASLDITGDIDLIAKVALDDWTPAAVVAILVGKNVPGANSSYGLQLHQTGALRFVKGALSGLSTVATGLADGSTKWVRVTHNPTTGATDFYLSDDGSAWIQLGTTVTVGAATPLVPDAGPLTIGAASDGTFASTGKVFRAIVKNGIGGTTVFDADFSTWNDGDGMGGYPKRESTNKAVLVLSDTTGADSNDPKWLAYSTDATSPSKAKGLYLPGVSGNYASVPDSAALDITGDITLDADVALDDWSPASTTYLVGKDNASDPTRSFVLLVRNTGVLGLVWWPLGTTASQVSADSTVAVPAVDGQRLFVRGSLDVDGNTGGLGYRAKFFTSPDGVTWTQLGADVTGGAAPTSIFASTSVVAIGAQSTGTSALAAGRFFRARVYNAYTSDGSNPADVNKVLDIDFADATEPFATFAADSGQTVTINRSASGKKAAVVDRPMFLFGTDDYMECADHAALDVAAADPVSLMVAHRFYGTPSASEAVLAKRSSTGSGAGTVGYVVYTTGTSAYNNRFDDGAVVETTATPVIDAGEALVAGLVRSVADDNFIAYGDGVAGAANPDSTTATFANAEALRLSRLSGAGTGYFSMELVGAAVWKEALTAADVALLDGEFSTNA